MCIVHLEDFSIQSHEGDDDLEGPLRQCRWFTRGWTLQELLAPFQVLFVDREWRFFGQKYISPGLESGSSRLLLREIEVITGIPRSALDGASHSTMYSAAQRLSWASKRNASRPEDVAYCLLGLLDVNMPLLYGEGGARAFRRLQYQVLSHHRDESIFAWSCRTTPGRDFSDWSRMLAPSPRAFRWAGDVIKQRSIARSIVSNEENSWQLSLTTESPRPVAFRHPDEPNLLIVRLNCVQPRPGDDAVIRCIAVLRLVACGHYLRVHNEGLHEDHFNSSLPRGKPLDDREGVAPLDEGCVAEPDKWEPVLPPMTVFIHAGIGDYMGCGRYSESMRTRPEETYLCLGEAQSRVVQW